MGGLIAALATLAQPILARVLLSLGLAAVTLTGISAAVGLIQDRMLEYVNTAPMAVLQLAGLAGVWTGLGMVLGSVTFAVTYWAATRAVRIAGA